MQTFFKLALFAAFFIISLIWGTSNFPKCRYEQLTVSYEAGNNGETLTGLFYTKSHTHSLCIWDESDDDMPYMELWKKADGLWYHNDTIAYEMVSDAYEIWFTTTTLNEPNIILSHKICN